MSDPDEELFVYFKMDELPEYWRMKIRGWGWGPSARPRCPYDGGGLVKESQPIDHVQCLKCGRNYA